MHGGETPTYASPRTICRIVQNLNPPATLYRIPSHTHNCPRHPPNFKSTHLSPSPRRSGDAAEPHGALHCGEGVAAWPRSSCGNALVASKPHFEPAGSWHFCICSFWATERGRVTFAPQKFAFWKHYEFVYLGD